MSKKSKIDTFAIFLQTESGDDYIFCLKGTVSQVVASIADTMGDELAYVSNVSTAPLESDIDLDEAINSKINKMREDNE